MNNEKTYYEKNGVTVTSVRVMANNKVYPLSGLSSVYAKKNLPGFAPVPIGLAIAATSYLFAGSVVLVLIILGITGFVLFQSKTTFKVVLGAAGKEVEAFRSFDLSEVDEIVAAINKAIVEQSQ